MSSKGKDDEGERAPGRRVVALPTWSRAPIALIAQSSEVLLELERALRGHGPLVRFPSLAHFVGDMSRADRWSAIVVARACAWDARLDAYVTSRSRIALFGLGLSREWPAGVVRLDGERVLAAWLSDLDDSDKPKSRTARPPSDRAPRTGQGPGAFLVIGESPEPVSSLLGQLRRVRSVRLLGRFEDLPESWRIEASWTGVVALHEAPEEARALARHRELFAVFRGRSEHAGRAVDDEPQLLAWLSFALAFEHTGDAAAAAAIERTAQEFDLRPAQAELLAVSLRTDDLDERARLLGTRPPSLHAMTRELAARTRGLRLSALRERIVPSGLGPLPEWAPQYGGARRPVESWDDLVDRLPDLWRDVPLVSLPPFPGERSLLGAARVAGVRTLGALLALPREQAPSDWHQNPRQLRALEELLSAAPVVHRGSAATDDFVGWLDDVTTRLPQKLSALMRDVLDDSSVDALRTRHALSASALCQAVQASVLRLATETETWRRASDLLVSAAKAGANLRALGEREPWLSGLASRPSHVRLVLWLADERRVNVFERAGHLMLELARTELGAREPSPELPIPWRGTAPEKPTMPRVGFDAELATAISACLAREHLPSLPPWHELAGKLPAHVANTSPEEVFLPVRLRNFARRVKAATLAELFAHPELRRQSIGYAMALDAVMLLASERDTQELRELAQTSTMLEAFERRLASLAQTTREVISARVGLRGEPRSLRELASARQTTHGALRQVEKRAMEAMCAGGWGEAVRERIERTWRSTWSLHALSREDWFRGVDQPPGRHVLYYLCEWVFDAQRRPRPSMLDGIEYVTTLEPRQVEPLYDRLIESLCALSGPPRAEVVHETVARLVSDPELAHQFIDRLRQPPRA